MSERRRKLVEDSPRAAVFTGARGQEYFLPIGEGTNGHTLSFVSWLLIRIELLAFLMQTVVTCCRHVDSSARYVGQRCLD